MGDVAMIAPVVRALILKYPDIKITVLTRRLFRPVFEGIERVSVLEADLKSEHKGLLGLYKLSKQLKLLNIDAIADLHNVLRTKVLLLFFRHYESRQIDKGRAEKKALISGKVFRQLKTTFQRYADVFDTLGYPIDLTHLSFFAKSRTHIKA